jgi:hypothetical protein
MTVFRTVAASRGAAWIADGVAGLRRQPGAYVGACLLVGFASALPLLGMFVGLLMPVFYGGLLSLLRVRAEGGTGRAGQVFDGFTAPGALARLLPIVSFNVLFALLAVAVISLAAGPTLLAVAEAAQGGGQPSPALVMELLRKLAPPLLALAPVGIFVGWMQMLAIPRAMLDGVPGGRALREAAAAAWANFAAFAVNLLCLLAVLFGLVLVLAVPMIIVGVVQRAAPGLGLLLQLPLTAALTALVQGLYGAMMFQAARDVFPVAEAPPPVLDAIEA